MERFEWVPNSVSPNVQPRIKRVQFGDGYDQRGPDGINNALRVYTLEFSDRPEVIRQIDDFLATHGGVTAFEWQAPDTWQWIRVICSQWSGPITGPWRTLGCTFEQVMA